ncbi:hypothetical protein B0H12DRAFT_1129083, partial [Mycena haematopus]
TYTVENHTIAVDSGEINIRTISPTPVAYEGPEYPVLVYFHGGGWAIGDLDMDDFNLRILSVELRLAIANVDYRSIYSLPRIRSLQGSTTAAQRSSGICSALSPCQRPPLSFPRPWTIPKQSAGVALDSFAGH